MILAGRRCGRSPLSTAKNAITLAILITLIALGSAGYYYRSVIVDLVTPPPPPDATAINRAVDSALVMLDPQEVSSGTAPAGDSDVPRDRLILSGSASVLRANLTITRAAEKAGGSIHYGVESTDDRRRWQTVTLGISAGDSLIREVMLVGRVR
jgi:hypothetical protein